MDDSLLDEIIGNDADTEEQKYSIDYNIDDDFLNNFVVHVCYDDTDEEVIYSDNDILSETIHDAVLPLANTQNANNIDNDIKMVSHQSDDVKEKSKMSIHEFCCLCGVSVYKHRGKLHKFSPCIEEYRCKKCYKFFYQHDHLSNPCFQPFKYMY